MSYFNKVRLRKGGANKEATGGKTFDSWSFFKGVAELGRHIINSSEKLSPLLCLTIIPRARMSSESIAHEAEGRMGC